MGGTELYWGFKTVILKWSYKSLNKNKLGQKIKFNMQNKVKCCSLSDVILKNPHN